MTGYVFCCVFLFFWLSLHHGIPWKRNRNNRNNSYTSGRLARALIQQRAAAEPKPLSSRCASPVPRCGQPRRECLLPIVRTVLADMPSCCCPFVLDRPDGQHPGHGCDSSNFPSLGRRWLPVWWPAQLLKQLPLLPRLQRACLASPTSAAEPLRQALAGPSPPCCLSQPQPPKHEQGTRGGSSQANSGPT